MIGTSELFHEVDFLLSTKFCSLLKWINLQAEKLLDLHTDQPLRNIGICSWLQISVLCLF